MSNGQHRRNVKLVYQTALMLPYEATRSLGKFLDAISAHLSVNGAADGPDCVFSHKLSILQLGLWCLNLPGRRNLVRYFASVLYTFETQFKHRVAAQALSSGDQEPPNWPLPTYCTGAAHELDD